MRSYDNNLTPYEYCVSNNTHLCRAGCSLVKPYDAWLECNRKCVEPCQKLIKTPFITTYSNQIPKQSFMIYPTMNVQSIPVVQVPEQKSVYGWEKRVAGKKFIAVT